jgi:hypothetical protein
MTTSLRRTLLALTFSLAAAPAAAQTLPGAFSTPPGEYEYRWRVHARPDGTVQRTPARGFLRLNPDGRFAHERRAEGLAWSRQSGGFDKGGNFLYISTMASPGDVTTAATDTFVVRHPGDRLFLWQNLHGEGSVEYELAPAGAPAARTPAPGLIPGLYGYVAEILYFEAGTVAPRRSERRFATTFPAASTRTVWVQLQVEYPIAMQAAELDVNCRIRDAGGRVMTESRQPLPVARGSAARFHTFGWGGDAAGAIPAGTYRVGCVIDGAEMMEGTFQVT